MLSQDILSNLATTHTASHGNTHCPASPCLPAHPPCLPVPTRPPSPPPCPPSLCPPCLPPCLPAHPHTLPATLRRPVCGGERDSQDWRGRLWPRPRLHNPHAGGCWAGWLGAGDRAQSLHWLDFPPPAAAACRPLAAGLASLRRLWLAARGLQGAPPQRQAAAHSGGRQCSHCRSRRPANKVSPSHHDLSRALSSLPRRSSSRLRTTPQSWTSGGRR